MSGVALSPVRGIAWTRVPMLVPVLLVAGVLRLMALGQVPFSMDESATAVFAGLSWDELLHGLGRLETNPPAFYVLEKLWTGLAGTSDWAFRMMPALSGVAGVAAVAVLARAAFGARAGMWAGLLLATQAHHLGHSREARVYALLFLVIALAMLAARCVATWQAGPVPWRSAAVLTVLSAAAMALHYTGPVAAACVFVYAGVVAIHQAGPRLPRLAILFASGVGALVMAMPSLIAMLELAGDPANNTSWIPVPGWAMVLAVVHSVFAAPYEGTRTLPIPFVQGGITLGVLIVGSAIGWGLRHTKTSADAAGMLAGLLAALVLFVGISQAVPIFLERTIMFSLVFFIPLLGAALAALPGSGRIALLLAVALAQGPALTPIFSAGRWGQDWSDMASILQRETNVTGWPVIVLSGFEAIALERYLPLGDPGRPRISVTPEIGERLTERVTWRLSGAVPLSPSLDADTLCKALGRQEGILLLLRERPDLTAVHATVSKIFTEAGGTAVQEIKRDRLAVERWSGVCIQVAAP